MSLKTQSILSRKKSYLQVALNSTLFDAEHIISRLPQDERIIIEAGTPLIKEYGMDAVRQIKASWQARLSSFNPLVEAEIMPYIVADLKTMDRGEREVEMVAEAGANGAIALGQASVETLNAFVETCEKLGIDSMIDMMNVPFPLSVLRALKKIPQVVILHRGVDEEHFNREKQIPLHEIRRIKGNYNILISVAGGDTIREVQRSIFNDADIVVIWKSVYQSNRETIKLVEQFLEQIK